MAGGGLDSLRPVYAQFPLVHDAGAQESLSRLQTQTWVASSPLPFSSCRYCCASAEKKMGDGSLKTSMSASRKHMVLKGVLCSSKTRSFVQVSTKRSATMPCSELSFPTGSRRCSTGRMIQLEYEDSASSALTQGSGKEPGVYMMMRGVSGEYLCREYARSNVPARYEGLVNSVAYAFPPSLVVAMVGVRGLFASVCVGCELVMEDAKQSPR